MKLLNFDRVLCLSPHPDDVEFSVSGTIKKFSDTVFDVFCLSYGGSTDSSSVIERIYEIQSFWKTTKNKNVNLILPIFLFLDSLNQTQLTTHIENTTINKRKYDAIFAPSYEDSHNEHQLISNIAMTLARNKPISVFEYQTPSTLHTWSPNFFVDIDSYCLEKIRTLRKCFKTQLDGGYFKQENLDLFHSHFINNKKKVAYRESFKNKIIYL